MVESIIRCIHSFIPQIFVNAQNEWSAIPAQGSDGGQGWTEGKTAALGELVLGVRLQPGHSSHNPEKNITVTQVLLVPTFPCT